MFKSISFINNLRNDSYYTYIYKIFDSKLGKNLVEFNSLKMRNYSLEDSDRFVLLTKFYKTNNLIGNLFLFVMWTCDMNDYAFDNFIDYLLSCEEDDEFFKSINFSKEILNPLIEMHNKYKLLL